MVVARRTALSVILLSVVLLFLGASRAVLVCSGAAAPANDPAQTSDACWKNAMSQYAMHMCADQDLRAAQTELRVVYQQVLALSAHTKSAARVVRAQNAWVAYRDAEMQVLYPAETLGQRGTVDSMCQEQTLENMTRDRINALKAILHPVEGNVCMFKGFK